MGTADGNKRLQHVNVLSIDGGGRRGYLPATFLLKLERELDRPLHQAFDYVCGTSTGGLLALGLAAGFSAESLVDMYENELPKIFARPLSWKLRTLWGLTGPKYSLSGLKTSMMNHFVTGFFNQRKLSDSLTNVMVTSYDIRSRRPTMFKSWDSVASFPFWSAACATSAAPTYFPAFFDQYIDGGVVFPDPTLAVLTDVTERHPDSTVTVLSLGTGTHEDGIRNDPGGLLGWATKVTDVFLDAAGDSTQYQARRHPLVVRAGSSLIRVQDELTDPRTRPMDGVVDVALRAAAERYVTNNDDGLVFAVSRLGKTGL